MAIKLIKQQCCDNCQKVLYGQDRAAFVDKEYIQIKGRITIQGCDDGRPGKYFVFVSRNDEEDLSFCDAKCFGEYAEGRKTWYNKDRAQKFREQAKKETDDFRSPSGGYQYMPKGGYPAGQEET